MGAAITLGDIVGKAQNTFVIRIGPCHRQLDRDVIFLRTDGDWRVHQRRL